MFLDAKSTFKWRSNPALDALAGPGGGIKGGGIHPEGQRQQTLTSRRRLRAHHRLAQERAAPWGITRNGHHRTRTWPPRWTGGRDQAGQPAQCGRQTGRPTSTSNTTSSTRRSRAHRERRRSRFGRGGMACTATTTPPTRLRIDRKLGRASAQPITTSSAICWMRAWCSRVAIPVDIACSLEMRVASIQSEAGGQLGRCELHESRRRAPAFSAPILV